MNRLVYLTLIMALIVLTQPAMAQDDDLLFFEDYEEIITTASKKAESIFDAPLSSTVLTAEDIRTAGVISIPEALRLIPGVIVREQTPGNFDVQLRGFDNVPPHSYWHLSANSITLVMIDNRIVYDYLNGGIPWEAFPISIEDIAQIEIIRGPSSALYGPNAVAGVINILTKKQEQQKTFDLQVQGGNNNTVTSYGRMGIRLNERLNLVLTGNAKTRNRHQTEYYEWIRDIYVEDVDTLRTPLRYGDFFPNPDERFPDPEASQEKFGINGFLMYSNQGDIAIDVQGGYQESAAQKIYVENLGTPLTNNRYETGYANLSAQIKGLSGQFAYIDGYQNIAKGVTGWQYDYYSFDAGLEYDMAFGPYTVRPGISYRQTEYDDSKHSAAGEGFLGGARDLSTLAFSIRSEFNSEKLRVIAALRSDQYKHPDKTYLSYQVGFTYKFKSNQRLVRVIISHANRGPFIIDTYNQYRVPVGVEPNSGLPIILQFIPNDNLDLLQMDMAEIGFRSKVIDNTYVDLESFVAQTKDYDDTIDYIRPTPTAIMVNRTYENLKVKATQIGLTGSVSFVKNDKVKLRAFGTLQKTEIKDHLPVRTEAAKDSLIDLDNKFTPAFYGGFLVNYKPAVNFNVNLNAYFYTRQTFIHSEATNPLSAGGITNINEKIILNARLAYALSAHSTVFLNARNLLNSSRKEYPFADDIEGTYAIGAEIHF